MTDSPTYQLRWVLGPGYDYYSTDSLPIELIKRSQAPDEVADEAIDSSHALDTPDRGESGSERDRLNKRVLLNNRVISGWLIEQFKSIQNQATYSDSLSSSSPPGMGMQNVGLLVNTNQMENGLVEYRILNLMADHVTITKWRELLDIISYRELIVQIDDFPSVKYDLSIEYETVDQHGQSMLRALRDWRELVKHILRRDLNRSISQIRQINDSTFRPVDVGGKPIYVSNSDNIRVRIMLKLEQYYGWKYLADNSLVETALAKLKSQPPIKIINGVYLVPFDSRYNGLTKLISPMISSLIADGYRSIELSSRLRADNNMLNMALELLDRFGYHVIKSSLDRPSLGKTDSDYPVSQIAVRARSGAYRPSSLTNWLFDSIEAIVGNQLPYVTVQCGDPIMSYDKLEERKAIMWYMAMQAYSHLIRRYAHLSTSIYRVIVYDDLSIGLPVSSSHELAHFIAELKTISYDMVPGSWNIFTARNLQDAIVIRWALYHDYRTDSMAFQLPIDSVNGKSELIYYVLTNRRIDPQIITQLQSRLRANRLDLYRPDIQRSIGSSFNLSALEPNGDLLPIIMNYVPTIDLGGSNQSISLQMINRDSFIRSTQSEPSGVGLGGATSSQHGTFNIFVNPATKRPISRESLSRLLMYQYGLMGWFDIGGDIEGYTASNTVFIPGLERTPPVRQLREIAIGRTTINGLLSKDDPDEFIMSVEAQIGDSYHCADLSSLASSSSSAGAYDVSIPLSLDDDHTSTDAQARTIPLFDLAYKRMEARESKISPTETEFMTRVNGLVAWLWRKGWFLSLWTTAVISKQDVPVLSCADRSYAYPLDDVLKGAASSPEAGKWAIQYLNLVVQTL